MNDDLRDQFLSRFNELTLRAFTRAAYYYWTEGPETREARMTRDRAYKEVMHNIEQQQQVQADDASEPESDIALMAMIKSEGHVESVEKQTKKHLFNPNVYLADSGASCHMGPCNKGMFNIKSVTSDIKLGDGSILKAKCIGNKRVTVIQDDGTAVEVVLHDYKWVPGLLVNLFSITKSLDKGWDIRNRGKHIYMKKNGVKIVFDRRLTTDKGSILGVEMVPRTNSTAESVAMVAMERGQAIDIMKFHAIIGHANEITTKKTASFYGLTLTGTFRPCESCAAAKSRQKNVKKMTESVPQEPGELLYMDISSVKQASIGGNKYWLLIVDAFTDVSWSRFLRRKSETKQVILQLLKDLKSKNAVTVKRIRCDNAGENRVTQQLLDAEGYGVLFEYTAPGSPQYNGVVERKFPTLMAKVRAMLNAARLPLSI